MRIDQAIETLQKFDKTGDHFMTDAELEAITLGIDALERIQHFRTRTLFTVRSPLLHEDAPLKTG